ncbi:MAG: ferrous iron transport protein A [Kiritimatiellia bacterium]
MSEALKNLATVESGHQVELVRVNSGHAMQSRLASMGLVPGTMFKVVRNDHRGPFIIGLKGARVVLGRGMADRIEVR